MTRKQMFATVTLAILGAGSLAYAADDGNPLWKIAEAVELINGNTAAIADQTSKITEQTTVVVQQNAAIANETAALAKANLQLDQKLDAVLNAIDKIEVPPPAPAAAPGSPAHAVWLAPYLSSLSINDHATFASAFVLNTGVVPATFTCNFFSEDGSRPAIQQSTHTLEPGELGGCSPKVTIPQFGTGWLVIVSDNPVVASGRNSRTDAGTFSIADNMVLRPIDCAGDQTGIEFVCDAVELIQKGK